jgi:hypothetical protein
MLDLLAQLWRLSVDSPIDRTTEEFAFGLKFIATQEPTRSDTGRNNVAIETTTFFDNHAKIHIVEFSTLRIALLHQLRIES